MIGEVNQGMEETLHETSTDGGNVNHEGCDDEVNLVIIPAWLSRRLGTRLLRWLHGRFTRRLSRRA